MTELLAAARLLGVASRSSESEMAYLRLVDHGLPVKTLERIAAAIAPSDAGFKYRIVPKASLARRKVGAVHRLSAAQSVLVTRLASVWAHALRVWKSPEDARDFLQRGHPLLDGRRPIELVLENELGADLVRSILGRLEFGSAA